MRRHISNDGAGARKRPRESSISPSQQTRSQHSAAAEPSPLSRDEARLCASLVDPSNGSARLSAISSVSSGSAANTKAWTAAEDFQLLEEVLTHGNRWTLIGRLHNPKREPNALRNRWNLIQSLIVNADVECSTTGTAVLRAVLEQWHAEKNGGIAKSARGSESTARRQSVVAKIGKLTGQAVPPSTAARAASEYQFSSFGTTTPSATPTVSVARSVTATSASSKPSTDATRSSSATILSAPRAASFGFPSDSESLLSCSNIDGAMSEDWQTHSAGNATSTATPSLDRVEEVDEVDQFVNGINDEAVQNFINGLVEKSLTDGKSSQELHSMTNCSGNGSIAPTASTASALEPLLSVMEQAEVTVHKRASDAASSGPRDHSSSKPIVPQWGSEQVHATVSLSVHSQVSSPSSSGPQDFPHETASQLTRGGTAAFMSAWLNLQAAGFSFNNPVWTNVFEPPRCMWKAAAPRMLACVPLPCLYLQGGGIPESIPCPQRVLVSTLGKALAPWETWASCQIAHRHRCREEDGEIPDYF